MTGFQNNSGHSDSGPSVGDINQMLTDRIESLMPELLPRGRRDGAEWREASTKHGGLGDSLSVNMRGAKAGIWGHFAAGQRGDLIDLIAYLRTGGDKGGAIRWARDYLGFGVAAPGKADAAALARAQESAENRKRQSQADMHRKRAWAQSLWLGAPPLKPGDVVDRYLSSRCIGLLHLGHAPGCLHAGQSVRHHDDGRDWPAMLAAVIDGEGRHCATHRTFLTEAGVKAPVEPVKQVLGAFGGGYVPLWKGAHSCSLRRLPAGVPVYISEGIEDGLSVALLQPDARVIAAVSLGNIAAVALPPQVRDVVLVGQNDAETLPNGKPHPAFEAFGRAVAAHAKAGRTVRVARPPAAFKDFNDWLRALRGEGAAGGGGHDEGSI